MSNEKTVNKMMERCKHFNGTTNNSCEAGVIYAAVITRKGGEWARYPCFANHESPVVCSHREFLTRDEAEAELAETLTRLRRMASARTAIVNHVRAQGLKPVNVAGAMACPICNAGVLSFSFAYNGHCHARCSTPHCVDWME